MKEIIFHKCAHTPIILVTGPFLKERFGLRISATASTEQSTFTYRRKETAGYNMLVGLAYSRLRQKTV